MPVKEGSTAPDFSLEDDKKNVHRLSDYRGRTVVLYFYPKDDTPGCTTEACNFRDDYSAYVNRDLVILGISPDTPESHAKFRDKFSLPFPLLADPDHKVCDLYGVWGPKKFMGRDYEGVLRTTFVIDDKGRVARVFENVKPAGHSAEILAAVKI
jgi:thioredoxin-dependent peroxiredoxin